MVGVDRWREAVVKAGPHLPGDDDVEPGGGREQQARRDAAGFHTSLVMGWARIQRLVIV